MSSDDTDATRDTDAVLAAASNWRSAPRPFTTFRDGNVRSLTYGIECDLDHQASYLETMLNAWSSRSPHWDFVMRADHELRDLREFRDRLQALELPGGDTAALRGYMTATQQLLKAIRAAAVGQQ